MPRILEASDESVAEAAGALRDGEAVAFPTETVYGLGADTFNEAALERVVRLKARPAGNPLIVHVTAEAGASAVTVGWDDLCSLLARRFWPGPLTLVCPRNPRLPELATAGWPTVAVRAPAHPVTRRLLDAFGGPVSAPSANRSGRVSPTRARHVADDFADVAELLILDGGSCDLGIESTVLDLTTRPPSVLRPGAVTVESLREVVGEVAVVEVANQAASPGTSARHYAPRTPAEMVATAALATRLAELSEPAVVLCRDPRQAPPPHRAIVMPAEADRFAACLYEALREADSAGVSRILIERPDAEDGLWRAIADRLRRATV